MAARATKPDILVLEIGSNDLCDLSADPEILGESITVFVMGYAVRSSTNSPLYASDPPPPPPLFRITVGESNS